MDKLKKTELFILILAAALLAMFFRLYIIKINIVKSNSMNNTLQQNDQVVILQKNKIFSKYKRNDLITFTLKTIKDQINNEDELYMVKRIIGLPGDIIFITNGQVFINDKLNKNQSILQDNFSAVPLKVESNSYFLLGDNRSNSFDSRKYGTINKNQIQGKVLMRIYPFSKIKFF